MLCPAILQRGKLRPKEAEWIYCSPAANGGDLKTGQGAEAADGPGCTSSPGPAGVHCIPKARIFGQHFPAWVALGAHSCLQQVSLLSSPPVHSQGQSLLSVDPAQPALGIRFRAQCPAQSVGGCWSQLGDRGGWETEAWGRKSEGQDQGVNPRKGGVWTPCTAMGSHGRWWRKVILPPGSLRGACWPVLKPQSCPLSQLGPPHFPCREQGPLALVGSQLQGKCLMLKQPHSMFPAASGLELEIDPTMTPTPAPKATI